jgi:hypothetical protein
MPTKKTSLPKTYGECNNLSGPCPFVSCRYNTYLDVLPNGEIAFNYRNAKGQPLEVWELTEPNCILKIADRIGISDDHIKKDGNLKLAYIAQHLTVSRPRAEQICEEALRKLKGTLDEYRP